MANSSLSQRRSNPRERELAGFLNYLKIEKGLSPLTLLAYGQDLRQFADFLSRERTRSLGQAKRQQVREFLDQLAVGDAHIAKRIAGNGKGFEARIHQA